MGSRPARLGTACLLALAAIAASPPRPPPRRAPPSPRNVRISSGDARGWRGGTISLDLKDADIKDVLRTFATLFHFNLVIDPEVRGSVTVRLEDVPWNQALDVILASNGLGYVLEGNVVRAGTPARLQSPD